MRIAIVGGVERGIHHYERLAASCGHEVELHGGHMQGRAGRSLESLVVRSDLVVIVTDVNSHLAVQQAKLLSRKHKRRQLIARNFGIARFSALLEALSDDRRATFALA